ncbi:MAG TPA: SRPBCC family protein [Acidimicrobiales bacterium]|nr:SRPBCC family protein [Acidimicrobiales bacterium]
MTHHSTAPPAAVFAVLADGERYADWVVGAKKIRSVDPHWPTPGAEFRHKVGVGPIEIKDRSTVQAVEPGRSITLKVRARPAGVARVHIELEPADDGGTEINMDEVPIEGIAKTIDNPLQRLLLKGRNAEALRRLATIAENEEART